MVTRTGLLPHPDGAVNCEWSLANASSVLWTGGAFWLKTGQSSPFSITTTGDWWAKCWRIKKPKCRGSWLSTRWAESLWVVSSEQPGWIRLGCQRVWVSNWDALSPLHLHNSKHRALSFLTITHLTLAYQSLLPEGDVCEKKSFRRGCYTPELPHSVRW